MLFSRNEIENVKMENGLAVAERFSIRTKTTLGKAKETLNKVIGEIEPNIIIDYTTGGRWSAHDLRFYLLEQTGPAKVFMSTWAMSETSSRLLLTGIETGLITELNCLFDRRLPVRKPKIMQLAQNICTRISLVDCHAKVTVIQNEKWSITIKGSANDTNNKRIESGVIFINKEVADFNLKWMISQLENGDPFNWKK